MFNEDIKEQNLKRLETAENEYKSERHLVEQSCVQLFETRTKIADEVIKPVELYINTLANVPVVLKKSVSELQISYDAFAAVFKMKRDYSERIERLSAQGVGSGLAIGAGLGILAPTGAMAVATAFGTASTGTAIASLQGAAATNAALAWLGGGSLATGGGGMAAGNALLAMAGPVGWGIAGISVLAGCWWKANKNMKIAEEVFIVVKKYERARRDLTGVSAEIKQLELSTINVFEGVKTQLDYLILNAPHNYLEFKDADDKELMALINNINSLSVLLNKRIGEGTDMKDKQMKPCKEQPKINKIYEFNDYEYVFIKAPMSGYVMKMLVRKGQEVEKNETILVFYTMLMKNKIITSQAGTVVDIYISEGKSVKTGDVMVILAKR